MKGRDSVYKGMLYTHVFLYWGLVAASCEAAGTANCHPLTLLGDSLRPFSSPEAFFAMGTNLIGECKLTQQEISVAALPTLFGR